MERGTYLNPFRSKKISTKFKGIRTSHKATHTPSTAKPGDVLSITVPKLKDKLFLPATFAMVFDMEIVLDPAEPGTTVNNYPVNNLAANIISRLVIKINSDPIFDLDNAHLYNTYKDLWLTEKQRTNSVFKGIQVEELRKLRSDLKATLADTKAANTTLRGIFGKRYVVPLNLDFMADHIPLHTSELDNIVFELTINVPKNVLQYSKAESIDFTMKNICLTYETLDARDLRSEVMRTLDMGFPFLFDDVHHYKRETVAKSKKQFNIDVDVDRKSLKGILIIFQDSFNDGERDSECFPNPGIENINFTIDGLPNALYNGGYKQIHHWDEIFKHFAPEELKKSHDSHMDITKYYNDNKYALWVDLRSTEDNNLHGTGKEQKESILMEITKKDNGTGDYTMYIFVVSDARIIIKDKKFQNIER